MKKKKSKSKKKAKNEAKNAEKTGISEVDKTFYELQIQDINRKVERLSTHSVKLEERNENLNSLNQQLDEDRADVIAYLRRTVQQQSDDIIDLVGRLESLKVTRDSEAEDFRKQLQDKDTSANVMRSELQSEIKLLEGKLNALEEFRLQREELQRKFDEQEARFNEQQKAHQEESYSIERKFISDKNTLVKHMEQKLTELSSDFQNVTDMRIAESTKRLIRENIAVSNHKEALVQEQRVLYKQRDEMKERCFEQRVRMEVATDLNNKCVKTINVQRGVIQELTTKFEELQKELEKYKQLEDNLKTLSNDLQTAGKDNVELLDAVEHLKKKLADCNTQIGRLKEELKESNGKVEFLRKTLYDFVFGVRRVVRQQRQLTRQKAQSEDENFFESTEEIITELRAILENAQDEHIDSQELETSVARLYQTGSAGFLPKIKQ